MEVVHGGEEAMVRHPERKEGIVERGIVCVKYIM